MLGKKKKEETLRQKGAQAKDPMLNMSQELPSRFLKPIFRKFCINKDHLTSHINEDIARSLKTRDQLSDELLSQKIIEKPFEIGRYLS